jgi:chromosome segregation ATPase
MKAPMPKLDRETRDKEIRAAIEAVATTGQEPTNELVRAQLGGRGSYSTISPVVRAWRGERTAQPAQSANGDAAQPTEVPAVVQQTLTQVGALLRQLAEAVPGQIDAAVNVERRRARVELDAEKRALGKQLQDLRTEITGHLEVIRSLEVEGQGYEDQIEDLKTAQENQAKAHEQALKDQQTRLDVQLDAARADHQRAIDQQARQYAERLDEVRKAKEALEAEKAELAKSHAADLEAQRVRFDRLAADLRADHQRAVDHMARQAADQQARLDSLESTVDDLNRTHELALRDQQERLDGQLAAVRADHRRELDRLARQHEALEATNRMLEQDKADLARSHAEALADQQDLFHQQLAGTRADLQGAVDRLSAQADRAVKDSAARLDELRRRNDALELEKADLARSHVVALEDQQARFDLLAAEMRADHKAGVERADRVVAELRQRLDGWEEARRGLERTIADLTARIATQATDHQPPEAAAPTTF